MYCDEAKNLLYEFIYKELEEKKKDDVRNVKRNI